MNSTFGKNIIPENEAQRLAALKRYQILDTTAEDVFDYVAQLATTIFKVPVSLVSLVDSEQVFFKANVGLGGIRSTDRGLSLCSQAILSPEVTVIKNALDDPSLPEVPHIEGEFGLRFYAGAPLHTPDGFRIGTVCVIDKQERDFTDHEKEVLEGLAKMVMHEMELRLAAIQNAEQARKVLDELGTANEELAASNEELNAVNEELTETQLYLENFNKELEQQVEERTDGLKAAGEEMVASEKNTRNIVANAPFPIGVYMGREMRITLANQSILDVWGKGNDVIGKLYAEVLPELDNQEIFTQLDTVFTTGKAFHKRNQQIDLLVQGQPKTYYFNYSFTPLTHDDGTVYGVMNTAADVTDVVLAKMQVEQSEQNLHNMVRQAPVGMCIVKGQPLMAEVMNDAFLEIIGKERAVFETTPYWVVNAEAAPYYEPITDQVLATGESYHANEHEIMLIRKGREETVHVDFVYEPIKNTEGTVDAIMIVAIEVTDKVNARKIIQEASKQLSDTNEELAAANEELAASNEEQQVANEDLVESQQVLQRTIGQLRESEGRFQNLIREATMGIIILIGAEMKVEIVNDAYAKLIGRNATDLLHQQLFTVIPETEAYFRPIIDKVRDTGEPLYLYDIPYTINNDGKKIEGFLNLVYQPYRETDDSITGVMVVCQDVTGQVNARKDVERAEESLRMATEAAELGTWLVNAKTREFIFSPRLKEIFGYKTDEELPYDVAMSLIHTDYREMVENTIENGINYGDAIRMEYPLTNHADGKTRWVRSIGKLVRDDNGTPDYITGIINEITEQKQDEIRKNDFIGMVSHELKTPLTSLTAIIQVLEAKFKATEESFINSSLSRAGVQVKRMAAMINGFLNISRLESGKMQLDKTDFDVEELISVIIDETRLTSPGYQITQISCDPVYIHADRDKISSVISNLLSNAVKYSPKGKNISVHCIIEKDQVKISVTDEGMGIRPADIEPLFDRYYRVDNPENKHISGFGIGLYLSAEIIRSHQGEIWVESTLGEGSTFFFNLPLL